MPFENNFTGKIVCFQVNYSERQYKTKGLQKKKKKKRKTFQISCKLTCISGCFKDTHREKAPSNKTPALAKCTNMDIWVVGTTYQFL